MQLLIQQGLKKRHEWGQASSEREREKDHIKVNSLGFGRCIMKNAYITLKDWHQIFIISDILLASDIH